MAVSLGCLGCRVVSLHSWDVVAVGLGCLGCRDISLHSRDVVIVGLGCLGVQGRPEVGRMLVVSLLMENSMFA